MPSILITGASGCVGSYTVDALSKSHKLFLLVRNPSKLRFDPSEHPDITVIQGDMDSIVNQKELLSQMDYCIHTATAWGGDEAERVNVQRVHEMFGLLNPERIKRIIYFSTASILGRDNRVLPEAGQFGTDYIKTKYLCYTRLPELAVYNKITTVFPTLVFGGDDSHPFSNLTLALPQLRRYSWFIGRLKLDLAFHYIHAQDIASQVKYFMESPNPEREYVLGNEAVLFGEFTKRAAEYFGHPIRWQIGLSPIKLYRMALFFGAKMSDWDRFCLEYQNFTYRTVNSGTFSLPSSKAEVESILADWKYVKQA